MPRYNWEELKRDFILGDYKSLNDFAQKKNIKINGNFKKRTKGWAEEKEQKENQKGTEIIKGTIQKQIEKEIDRNVAHLKLWDEFLYILQEALQDGSTKNKSGLTDAYRLEKFANVMEKAQKGQRLALGLDEKEQSDDGSLDKLVEALKKSQGDS